MLFFHFLLDQVNNYQGKSTKQFIPHTNEETYQDKSWNTKKIYRTKTRTRLIRLGLGKPFREKNPVKKILKKLQKGQKIAACEQKIDNGKVNCFQITVF